MRRREFITGLAGSAAFPLAARSQRSHEMRPVGVLMDRVATDNRTQSSLAAFTKGLRELGWIEGENIRIDIRWTAGDVELARIYAAQLIGLMPDVILASTSINLIAIQQATSTVPVVFVGVADPVAQGFVSSLKQPGGNLTGFSQPEFSIGGKWLGLLKEAAPSLARVAVVYNPETSPPSKFLMRAAQTAAPLLGMQTVAMLVRNTAEIEHSLESFATQPNGGLMLTMDSFTQLRHQLIIDLAGRYRLPAIAPAPNFAKDGGLMAYVNDDLLNQYRQAAGYVDRILKGSKPSDLPVQAPNKYRFIINLKTAKMLGLTIPLPLRGLADEVIE